MGLANRLVPKGQAIGTALELARDIAAHPQAALRSDRLSSYQQWSQPLDKALLTEFQHGMGALRTEEMVTGLNRYAAGKWRAQRRPA